MAEPKIYELNIPAWQCVVQPDWKLELLEGEEWVNPGPILVSRSQGARMRSGGGPEQEYLDEMLLHGYIREVTSESAPQRDENALV